jgi:Xaa-Pro dipeptidase
VTVAALLERMQEAVREEGVAGWLLFDFHGTNSIARRILGVGGAPGAPKTTRRWFYLVPGRGVPIKLVHRLEPGALAHLPGETVVYLTWQELDRALAQAIRSLKSDGPVIAMEYSPTARLPYVSRVDAGTVEMVRAAGARVVSSADLAQRFDGVLSAESRLDHRRTGRVLNAIILGAFARARDFARAGAGGASRTEADLQRWILERFADERLVSSDPPTVAIDAHSGDPHFSNAPATDAPIRAGSLLLIDAWAKADRPGAIYADYTQVAYLGASALEPMRRAFEAVRDARDAAVEAVRRAIAAGESIRGCDVDDAARGVIASRGLADRFVHRTGHSIGEEVHANGVHLDNLETRDERRLLDGTLVSVEPGVYFDDFGVRSEVNLLVNGREVEVTTPPIQRDLPALLP